MAAAKRPNGSKPLFVNLPVSLHIALQELIIKKWRKTGVKPRQRELLEEAIRRFVQAEDVAISQIEADVSNWPSPGKKVAEVSTMPNKRGRKPA